MATDNYIKVFGVNVHEVFFFDSKDKASGEKAFRDAQDCASQHDARRPKTATGDPQHPAALSVWLPYRSLNVIGLSQHGATS